MKSCTACAYFSPEDSTCRRFPPDQSGQWGAASFPMLEDPAISFCGEYKAKAKERQGVLAEKKNKNQKEKEKNEQVQNA